MGLALATKMPIWRITESFMLTIPDFCLSVEHQKTIQNFGNRKRGSKPSGLHGDRPRKAIVNDAEAVLMNVEVHNNNVNNFNIQASHPEAEEGWPDISQASDCVPENTNNYVSASARKFAVLEKYHATPNFTPTTASVTPTPSTGSSSKKKMSVDKGLSGYRIINVDFLKAMVASLSCGYCASNNIQLKETFNFFLSGFCKNCNDNIFSASTSESEKGASSSSKPSSSFINRRLVAASRNSGIGCNKLVHFFADMDMPQPLHLISWQAIDKIVHRVSIEAAEEYMVNVAKIIKSEQGGDNKMTVSFDGSWHKRGHSSHHGTATAIQLDSGFV